MSPASRLMLLVMIIALAVTSASAQGPATGTPPFGSFGGGPDIINLANLNAHLTIPVIHKPGRGTNFSYDLSYDSSVWYPITSGSTKTWQPVSGTWGWQGLAAAGTSYIVYAMTYTSGTCWNGGPTSYQEWSFTNFVYYDPLGVAHGYNYNPVYFQSPGGSNCPPNGPQPSTPQSQVASDGSGYTLYASPNSGYATAYMVASNGATINPPVGSSPPGSQGSTSITDRNGNQIASNNGVYTDTLGTTALTVAGTAPSNTTLKYTAPSGVLAPYTVSYRTYTVKTNFGCSGISEYGATSSALVDRVTLPDNSYYQFNYEGTPGYSGDVTGRIASVQLPTGGTITYSYAGGNNGIICADGSTSGLNRQTPDGTWTYARTMGTGSASTTTITDPTTPTANQTVIQFQGIYETQRQVYQGSTSGTLLATTNTCYNGSTSPCNGTAFTLPITQRTVIATLPGSSNLQSKHSDFFNSVGMPTETDDYDFGSGAPSSTPLRKVLYTYASLGNITAFQHTVTVYNGAGTQVALTNYNYDETTPTATSGLPQHVAVSGSRGNLTSVNQWVNTSGSNLITHSAYYDTGVVSTATAANGAVTTYNYSTCADAFPTGVNEPLGMSRSFAWNCTGGVLTSVTDENNQVTSTTYSDPYFWRPASQNFPDGGQTSWTYNSPTSVTTTTKMNVSQNIVSTVLLDGLGRTSQTQLNSDPQGVDYTVTTHDALGRTYQVYNSTRCNPPATNCGESTWGITSYQYDALSRPTSITDPDGSVATTSYLNNTVTVTDEAGKKRQLQADALGRTTQTTEDPSGLGYVTTYGFDALNDLTSVVQNGSRQRTFVYDSLSRLTSETNPESGTTTYTYDTLSVNPGNCSAHSSLGDLIAKVDANGNGNCYNYDALHRMVSWGQSYNSSPNAPVTPDRCFVYDSATVNGTAMSNAKGRLAHTFTTAQNAGCAAAKITDEGFSYDVMGRVAQQRQQVSGASSSFYSISYGYDLAGNPTSLTYPSGRVVNYTYNAASLPTQVTFASFNGTSVNYNYMSAATYAPQGAPASFQLGNGLTETSSYNSRLLLAGHQVSSSVMTPLNRFYSYFPNGNVNTVTDNLQSNRTQSFTYDSLNRVSTAASNATSGSDCWAQQFGYDAWGNLLTATPTRSGCPMTQLNIGVNAQNQITNSGFSYDAAGNVLADGTNTYAYNADFHLNSANSGAVTYTYDGNGLRVSKTVGSASTEYFYSGGQPISELNGATGDFSDYIYANGQLLARADTYENGIMIQGNNCSNCGWLDTWFKINDANYLSGYTIQSGDRLYWRQGQGNARGGMGVFFTDGTNNAWSSKDQNGNYTNDDPSPSGWDYRYVDLSSYAGKVLSWIGLDNDGNSPSGAWTIIFGDIALISVDGTVRPIHNGSANFSVSLAWTTTGVTGVSVSNRHLSNIGWNTNTTTNYYSSDHLGSARTILSYWGYPTWSATFLPFGQEWNPQSAVNHYKFTSDERDSETGLDHTQFRQYSSPLGRWMHPDPAGLAAVSLGNPQSWNRYAYVRNNPLNRIDPTGMNDCEEHVDCGDSWLIGPQPGQDLWGGLNLFPDEGSNPDPWDGRTSNGFCLCTDGIIAGNNIFDAVTGAPGTFLTLNMHGQQGFGFSENLWSATWNFIDAANAQTARYGTGPVATSGYQVYFQSTAGGTLTSGFIPELYAAAAQGASQAGPLPLPPGVLPEALAFRAEAAQYFCQTGQCDPALAFQTMLVMFPEVNQWVNAFSNWLRVYNAPAAPVLVKYLGLLH